MQSNNYKSKMQTQKQKYKLCTPLWQSQGNLELLRSGDSGRGGVTNTYCTAAIDDFAGEKDIKIEDPEYTQARII